MYILVVVAGAFKYQRQGVTVFYLLVHPGGWLVAASDRAILSGMELSAILLNMICCLVSEQLLIEMSPRVVLIGVNRVCLEQRIALNAKITIAARKRMLSQSTALAMGNVRVIASPCGCFASDMVLKICFVFSRASVYLKKPGFQPPNSAQGLLLRGGCCIVGARCLPIQFINSERTHEQSSTR